MNYSLYLIDDRLVIDLGAGEKSQHKAFSGVPELVETHIFCQEPIGQVEISEEQLKKLKSIFIMAGYAITAMSFQTKYVLLLLWVISAQACVKTAGI